jgi:methionyl-tRNA synthetase
MMTQLGLSEHHPHLFEWDSVRSFGAIPSGTRVQQAEPIFPRLDMEPEIAYIVEAMSGSKGAPQPVTAVTEEKKTVAEGVALIGIDEFAKVELRVAEVVHAEPIPKADMLLKLQLNLGEEERQVVSGIAKYYQPNQLIGRKIVCVTNLKPVKLRGEWSHGMILAASSGEQLRLVTIDGDIPNGARVK